MPTEMGEITIISVHNKHKDIHTHDITGIFFSSSARRRDYKRNKNID